MPFNISMESILKLFAPFMSVFKLSPTAKILCLVLNSILGNLFLILSKEKLYILTNGFPKYNTSPPKLLYI